MSMLAVITARGGSKRIPRKNIKEFFGKPIMTYGIQAALDSGLFDEVMVSTEDAEIADIAVRYGAKVPFLRSAEMANDYAGTRDVLMEVVSEYEKRGRFFDYLCCIYPAAAFLTAEKLREAYKILIDEKVNGVHPVVKYSSPPQGAYAIRNGRLEQFWEDRTLGRTQDMEPLYYDVGQFYFYTMKALKEDPKPFHYAPIIVSEMEAQDIDNPTDWELLEMKYQRMLNKKAAASI